jgi:tRNA(Ile)-lysidine synthase
MKNTILTAFYNSLVRLVKPKETVIAAVSGGADSVALFHLLNLAREEFGIKVVAAHFNHKLRGKESLRDELFVRKLAALYGAPFELSRMDVKKAAKTGGGGIEKTARDLRYSFLARTARKYSSKTIALGHNLDDNAETFVFRLITGAGAAGMSAIPVEREAAPGIMIIRPLLEVMKKDITGFLKDEKIPFVFDSSNSTDLYTRNRIRNSLIPLIEKEYNAGFRETAAKTAFILTRENEFMEMCAQKALKKSVLFGKKCASINIKIFMRLHESLRFRVAAAVLRELLDGKRKVAFTQVAFVEACAQSGAPAALPEGYFVSARGNYVTVSKPPAKPEKKAVVFDPRVKGKIKFNDSTFTHTVVKNTGKFDLKDKNCAYIAAESVKGNITVRFKEDGDRFVPFGMTSPIKLKKFFIDNKLEKDNPVFADDEKILWVARRRISEKVGINRYTKSIVKIVSNPAG